MKLQDEFSELKAAALAATQGKWEMGTMPVTGQLGAASHIMSLVIYTKGDSNLVHAVTAGVRCTAVTGTGPNSEHNARYIAAASPTVVLSLLAELEKAQQENIYFCNLNAQKNERIAELERARFIAWPGNMFAPVLARIKVDVKRRDGSVSIGQSGGNVIWYHSDKPNDVVAFALTAEANA
ncbi:ead/Ea22-like family protein [Serratia proteamaculans]|uniref:ead/Ea22-like family protein n=1 Tax=Serratia proteamaculans TaxID=28151 RepID=UPI001C568430|nr:ead/Ea22-like family protein [Serratia proteamaculans]WEO91513.1 ead/Ea22-like family protein [Serratia proteamaculans]